MINCLKKVFKIVETDEMTLLNYKQILIYLLPWIVGIKDPTGTDERIQPLIQGVKFKMLRKKTKSSNKEFLNLFQQSNIVSIIVIIKAT